MTDPIYENGYTDSASSKALRLYSLARVGVASTDSAMSVDLSKGGYTEMFDIIGRLAFDLVGDIEDLERLAKVGPLQGLKDQTEKGAA